MASTLLDQDVAPVGWKKSCQNVLSGWLRLPIGSVTHVPAIDWMEVASGVGMAGPETIATPPAGGATEPLIRTERQEHEGNERPWPRDLRHWARAGSGHDPLTVCLMALASVTAKEDFVAAVEAPGSLSKE